MAEAEYDVAIVGGGIGGLYTAWRLMRSTKLKIALFEASDRFGGRYHTVLMPGGFAADLGAARFIPLNHQLLYKLTQDLGLEIEKSSIQSEVESNTHGYYFKNQHVKGTEDLMKLFSVNDEDKAYFRPCMGDHAVTKTSDGNAYEARCNKTGMFAKDMPGSLYVSLPMNSKILYDPFDLAPMSLSVGDRVGFLNMFEQQPGNETSHLAGLHGIKGGMEQVIIKLVADLERGSNVQLQVSANVTTIKESNQKFEIVPESSHIAPIRAKKLILACNGRGIEYLSWNSPYPRATQFRRLINRVHIAKAIKLYLTYEAPWWEEKGLITGSMMTDLPMNKVTAFGSRGKSSNYATLLAVTYANTAIFDGLNQQHYPRFENKVGDVPTDLIPSKLLVDYVQKQLHKMFDMEELPSPVCALTRMWIAKDSIAAHYESGIGEDPYQLQWDVIKPFPDADIFVTGDTFTACKEAGPYIGWSEGVLLNTERILAKHFDVSSYIPDREMVNQRAKPLQE